MIARWLMAAAIGVLATGALAAEVQIFGIHVPTTGDWAVYARISDPTLTNPLPGMTQAVGLASIYTTITNNNDPTNTQFATVVANSVTSMLPYGTSSSSDAGGSLGYGFWVARSTTPASNVVYTANGVRVGDSQFTFFNASDNTLYKPLVLEGTGLTAGSKSVGGVYTSATAWAMPLLVAKGKYTPPATSGNNSLLGLKLGFQGDPGANVLRDMDPTAAVAWSGGTNNTEAASLKVIDSRTFIGVTIPAGSATGVTVRAAAADANLDSQVNFDDLLILAQNYNSSNATWFTGDFSLDGKVDFDDLLILAQYYNQSIAGEPVNQANFSADVSRAFASISIPEPSGVLVLILASSSLTMCRGRRKIRVTGAL